MRGDVTEHRRAFRVEPDHALPSDDAATNFTLFASFRLAKVEPYAWLRLIIARLHAGDIDYDAMTPAACAASCPART